MTAKHRRPPVIHRGRRTLAGVAAAALLTVGVAGTPALAAKGGGGNPSGGTSGSSITLETPLVNDLNGDGQPNWGDTVTFAVSTGATTQPNVSLTCSQNGTAVYSAVTGYYAGYPWPWTQDMTLSSQSWSGGTASCVARLYMFTRKGTSTLATTSFTAGA